MKIALVNTSLRRGRGSDRVVCELAASLARSNGVVVFSLFEAELVPSGARVVARRCGRGRFRRFTSSVQVLRELYRRAGEFDVINCHHAILSLLLPSKSLVTTYHGYVGRYHSRLDRRVAGWLRWLVAGVFIKWALRRSAASTAVSQALLAELGPLRNGSQVRVIHNGVEALGGEDECEDLPSGGYFLYCGRISRDKSVDTLVSTYATLGLAVPLLLAGEGELRRQLEDKFGGDRIRFVGLKTTEELAALYRNSIGFVTASTYESFCLPVIEAAAFGKPSVGPRSGAMPEVIDESVTGFLYGSREEFGECLRLLVTMKDAERRRLAAACRDWSRRFRWNERSAEYLAVFREIGGEGSLSVHS